MQGNDKDYLGQDLQPCSNEQLIDRFLEVYFGQHDESCKQALMNLYQDHLVDIKTIRNYLIVHDYIEELVNWSGVSTKAVEVIAMKYTMSSRQVQNVLYKWEGKFRGVKRNGN